MRARTPALFIPLFFMFSMGGFFSFAPQAQASVIDSQTDDSAQATRPETNIFLAVGYVPTTNFNLAGIRFRVNKSGDGDYLCPAGGVMQNDGTSTPVLWDRGRSVGNIVLVSTTTPDAKGNCDYTTIDNYGRALPIPVSAQNYYVFLMATGGDYSKWVSMSGKPFSSSTPMSFFGYRSAFSNYYVWGTTGLDAPYFEMFDTAPPLSDPCAAPGSCASNVLFLPGIEGSRLYRPNYSGGADKLWEPNTDGDVKDLFLDTDGTSVRYDVYAKERNIIDELPDGVNIYKSFIARMDSLKASGTIRDWEPVAYDWRLSLDDILSYGNDINGRIYYSGDLRATSTPYIIQELHRLAASSQTGKVTIVAHSNGGLVAKRLTEILGPVESAKFIDKIIFVAVPQAGTPEAIATDMHGHGQEFGVWPLYDVLTKSTARTFASTSPVAYNLLPSAQYFTQVDNPVVTFDSSLTDWISRYENVIHSQELLRQFLTGGYGRVDAQTGDVNQPVQLHDSLLTNAETLHASLDSWAPPSGVSLVQIAGWGIPSTVSGITYKKKDAGVAPDANFTIDGDGTVVVPSALWTSTTTDAKDYWVNLRSYNSDHPVGSGFGLFPFDHSRILEASQVVDFLSDQITNTTKLISSYAYLSTQAPSATDSRLRYTLHSPLTLNLYDTEGRHTGVSTTTGRVEEQIPDTYYTEIGDVKYLFTDASTSARIVLDGYAPGVFTLNVDEYSGDTRTASTTFKDIPTTASTIVTIDVQSDITTLSPMAIDENGDGTVDAMLAPKMNGSVTLDTTPPELRLTFSTTTQSLSIIGTDDGGAVTLFATTTQPKLDWEKGRHNERVRGEAPELQGAITTVTASDAAGNTATLVYVTQSSGHGNHLAISVKSLTYTVKTLAQTAATTTLPSTTLVFDWARSRKNSYETFESFLHTSTTTVMAMYQARPNRTIVITSAQNASKRDRVSNPINLNRYKEVPEDRGGGESEMLEMRFKQEILPGLVIPYMEAKKGNITINY
ncbi:MAG: lipase/acyltransferase domain-containing protein [Minisyncoccota bacterium]